MSGTSHVHRQSRFPVLRAFAFTLCLPVMVQAGAQEIHLDTDSAPPSRAGHVSLLTDTATVEAGKPDWIELRFHVDPGFHINSHIPGDQTLIPTSFQAAETAPDHLLRTEFPPGTPFHLQLGAGQTLSTYQADFTVRLQLQVEAKGDSTFTGRLHYQACDNASCFPPRDLPVRLAIHAR